MRVIGLASLEVMYVINCDKNNKYYTTVLDVLSRIRIRHHLRVVGAKLLGPNLHPFYSNGFLHLWFPRLVSHETTIPSSSILEEYIRMHWCSWEAGWLHIT